MKEPILVLFQDETNVLETISGTIPEIKRKINLVASIENYSSPCLSMVKQQSRPWMEHMLQRKKMHLLVVSSLHRSERRNRLQPPPLG